MAGLEAERVETETEEGGTAGEAGGEEARGS